MIFCHFLDHYNIGGVPDTEQELYEYGFMFNGGDLSI